MSDPTTLVSGSDLIDKRLFEAGMQCAKRLYLDHRESGPPLSPHRQELAEVGARLVELAAQAFPRGTDLSELDVDAAVEKTTEVLSAGGMSILFHAAFRGGGAEARVDIVMLSPHGDLDLFEVKAGTTIKPRHLMDVAMHIHAIEACGYAVKSATILHLDPRYEHAGGKNYPVASLFKNVNVTDRARKLVPRVQEELPTFRGMIDDEDNLELPMGTRCTSPLPCHHLARCRAEGAEHPLLELPQLTPKQETAFNERAIEEIGQLDLDDELLTAKQQRVVRAVQEERLVIEPFVATELADLDWPVAYLDIGWHMEVLPRFESSKPWQKMPFLFGVHTVHQDGRIEFVGDVSREPDDPRPSMLPALDAALADAGTVVIYPHGFDDRFRALLDENSETKSHVRSLLQSPLLELGQLIQAGLSGAKMHGQFDLATVFGVVTEALDGDLISVEDAAPLEELEIRDEEAALEAYRRLLNRRTRASTREKLSAQLLELTRSRSAQLLQLTDALRRITAKE